MFLSGYRFAEDEANFSINTDDPMVTGHDLQGDYNLAHYWGLTEARLIRAVSNIQNPSVSTEFSAQFLPVLFFPCLLFVL
jgi:hypothetical protein